MLKLAVIGLRYGITAMEDLMNSPASVKYRLESVFDLDREKTEKAAEKFDTKAAVSLEEILESDVQVVGIFTPPSGRAKLIERCLLAGKDIMTTKPFELDPKEAERVLQLACKLKRVIHLNSPGIRENGVISQVRSLAQHYDMGQAVSAQCSVWVNYHEKPDNSWYDDPERCPVAPIFRLGIYMINDLVRLIGKPKEICALESRISTERPTPDNAQLSILFDNGALANIYASFCIDDGQRYYGPSIFHYERGTFYYHSHPGRDGLLLVTGKDRAGNDVQEEKKLHVLGGGHYYWDIFYQSVLERAVDSRQYQQEILWGVQVLQAMKESISQGRAITL